MNAKWNTADKALWGALLLFLSGLAWHSCSPGSLWAEGLLFTAEAALVGGVADWFAVTALFRKPLGFPYHTAILPKRRHEFSAAMVRLIQQEIFSRRQLFSLLRTHDWKAWLLDVMKTGVLRDEMQKGLDIFLREVAADFDVHGAAQAMTVRLQARLRRLSFEEALSSLRLCLQKEARDRRWLAALAHTLRAKAEGEELRAGIAHMLREVQRKKTEEAGVIGALFSSLSEAMDLVNVDELATIIQKEIVSVLGQLGEADSNVQTQALTIFYECLSAAETEEGLRKAYETMRDGLTDHVVTEQGIKSIVGQLQRMLREPRSSAGEALYTSLRAFLEGLLSHAAERLREDTEVGEKFDDLVYDMVARSTLQAHAVSGLVAREVMGRMTDEQLNRIVYSKIEPDMLWIRLNGTVLGAILGGVLFLLRLALGYGGI
ncbi:MAG: DUF445 family protein [Schwartzia sp. (in: firmicutes)]